MENKNNEKLLIGDYPNLPKYKVGEVLDYENPNEEMIDLIKQYLPIHICVGTIWKREKNKELEQSELINSRCKELRKKILDFPFYGCLTFIMNGEVIVIRIYDDDDDEQKSIEIYESHLIEYNYEFI